MIGLDLSVSLKLAVKRIILKWCHVVDLILDSVWIILVFYCKFVHLHPRYHPNKKIKYSKTEAEEHVCLHSRYYAINYIEDENVDYIDNINRPR